MSKTNSALTAIALMVVTFIGATQVSQASPVRSQPQAAPTAAALAAQAELDTQIHQTTAF